jgi:hypothetical protein
MKVCPVMAWYVNYAQQSVGVSRSLSRCMCDLYKYNTYHTNFSIREWKLHANARARATSQSGPTQSGSTFEGDTSLSWALPKMWISNHFCRLIVRTYWVCKPAWIWNLRKCDYIDWVLGRPVPYMIFKWGISEFCRMSSFACKVARQLPFSLWINRTFYIFMHVGRPTYRPLFSCNLIQGLPKVSVVFCKYRKKTKTCIFAETAKKSKSWISLSNIKQVHLKLSKDPVYLQNWFSGFYSNPIPIKLHSFIFNFTQFQLF